MEVIQLVLQAIDRLINLVQRRDVSDRAAFERVATPIFEQLEIVHRDYMAIFNDLDQRFRYLRAKRAEWLRENSPALVPLDETMLEAEPPFDVAIIETSTPETDAWLQRAKMELGLLDPRDQIMRQQITDLRAVAQDFRARRLQFEPVRQRLREMVRVASNATLPLHVRAFVNEAVDYLPAGAPRLDSRKYSERYDMITPSMHALDRFEEAIRQLDLERVGVGPMPTKWYSIAREIEIILQYHREHWARVCQAYERARLFVWQ
ncbi:MAG: hypothetical protein AABO58_00050 [Acidobacteriota bacterium]